jgi:hypothetical protein
MSEIIAILERNLAQAREPQLRAELATAIDRLRKRQQREGGRRLPRGEGARHAPRSEAGRRWR